MEIEKNIEEIIHSYLEASANEAELVFLLNWIKQSKENASFFNQICNIWENSDNVTEQQNDTELALNKLNERIRTFIAREEVNKLGEEDSYRFIYWKAAAVAILITGISIFFYIVLTRTNNNLVSEYVTAIAPKSQKSQLILADGTKVWLNSGTTLKYKSDYGITDRQIFLEGEAYFEVAKNPGKPFLVYASNIIVKAIGTSFNVKCYSEDNIIETTLLEGKVQVSKNENESKDIIFLLPNQRAVFSRLDNKLVIASNEELKDVKQKEETVYNYIKPKSIESVISWKNEELIFENEPFEELTKRLERWYNVEITVLNPEVNVENSYTGKFVNNESLEQVLKIISRTTPIKYSFRNGEVLIDAK